MPKMIVTVVYTMTNNKKQPTFNYSKQSQSNPAGHDFLFLDKVGNNLYTDRTFGVIF